MSETDEQSDGQNFVSPFHVENFMVVAGEMITKGQFPGATLVEATRQVQLRVNRLLEIPEIQDFLREKLASELPESGEIFEALE